MATKAITIDHTDTMVTATTIITIDITIGMMVTIGMEGTTIDLMDITTCTIIIMLTEVFLTTITMDTMATTAAITIEEGDTVNL